MIAKIIKLMLFHSILLLSCVQSRNFNYDLINNQKIFVKNITKLDTELLAMISYINEKFDATSKLLNIVDKKKTIYFKKQNYFLLPEKTKIKMLDKLKQLNIGYEFIDDDSIRQFYAPDHFTVLLFYNVKTRTNEAKADTILTISSVTSFQSGWGQQYLLSKNKDKIEIVKNLGFVEY